MSGGEHEGGQQSSRGGESLGWASAVRVARHGERRRRNHLRILQRLHHLLHLARVLAELLPARHRQVDVIHVLRAAALLLRLVALDVPPAELRRRRRDEGEQQERGAQHDVACDSH